MRTQRMRPLFDYMPKPKPKLKIVNSIKLKAIIIDDNDITHSETITAKNLTNHFAYWQTGKEHTIVHKPSGLVAVVLKNGEKVKELADELENFDCWDFSSKDEWEKWKAEKPFEYRDMLDIVLRYKRVRG